LANVAQRAMTVAMIYPEPEQRGRGNKQKDLRGKDFSSARLSQARSVFKTAPDLAKAVIEGTKSLNDAYDEVSPCATAPPPMELARLRSRWALGAAR
jgi:hypothetical protein